MEISGRLTSNAVIADVTSTDRKVVNFTVAVNDSYRPKGSTETKEYVTYFNCAYWIGTAVAKLLTKGSVVTVTGRLHYSAYMDKKDEPQASVRCHVNTIKILFSKKTDAVVVPLSVSANELTEPLDDLPF
jgi:single-strand DNA-binding protein